MPNKFAIILNAPSNAGKDFIAEHFSQYGMSHKEFKGSLFNIARTVANISKPEWDHLYHRDRKEVKTSKLFGRSPREHMIHTSEVLIKPVYGKDYFGNALLNSLDDNINIISDGGFKEEMQVLIDGLGIDRVLLIRIHRDGCSFENDSRDYIYDLGCIAIDVHNNSTPQDLFDRIGLEITSFCTPTSHSKALKS